MGAESTGGEGAEGSGSILVDVAAGDAQAAVENAAVALNGQMDSGTLALQDVLQGLPDEGNADALGIYLSFESVGNSTVISVDTDGSGPATPIAIVTLDNITGITLQQLLNDSQIVT